MTERKIEWSDGCSFALQQLLANFIENFISYEKEKYSLWPDIYKALKLFWFLSWVSIAGVVARFPEISSSSSEPVAARSDCSRLGNALCLCSPFQVPTCPSSSGVQPQELGRWFGHLNLRLPSGTAFGEIARWQAGAQTWTQVWTLPQDQRVVKVYRLQNHSINCVEFEFLLSPLLTPNLSQEKTAK